MSLVGCEWNNSYDTYAEASTAIGEPRLNRDGWYVREWEDEGQKKYTYLLVMTFKKRIHTYCWYDVDPRPLIKQLLDLPEIKCHKVHSGI